VAVFCLLFSLEALQKHTNQKKKYYEPKEQCNDFRTIGHELKHGNSPYIKTTFFFFFFFFFFFKVQTALPYACCFPFCSRWFDSLFLLLLLALYTLSMYVACTLYSSPPYVNFHAYVVTYPCVRQTVRGLINAPSQCILNLGFSMTTHSLPCSAL
jgi:hypothetical protein